MPQLNHVCKQEYNINNITIIFVHLADAVTYLQQYNTASHTLRKYELKVNWDKKSKVGQ